MDETARQTVPVVPEPARPPARGANEPLMPEVAAAAERLSPGLWRDHAERAPALTEAGRVELDTPDARRLTAETAAAKLAEMRGGDESWTRAGAALADDPVLAAFLERKKAEEFASRDAPEEILTAEEEAEALREIERQFGPGVSPRDVLVITETQTLAGEYERAGQYHKALSLYAALRDRMWTHRKQHFSQTLDMMRQIARLKRPVLAFEAGLEHLARFCGHGDGADANEWIVLTLPPFGAGNDGGGCALFAQRAFLVLYPREELTKNAPMGRLSLRQWFLRMDARTGRLFDLAWPRTKPEQEAWLDAVAEQWPATDTTWLSPELAAYLNALANTEPADASLRRAVILTLAGRDADAVKALLEAPALTPEAFGLLARLVVFTEGDPRPVSPEEARPVLKRLPAEFASLLARRIKEHDPEGLYAAHYRDAFFADVEAAARHRLLRWLDDAAHAPRERIVGMAGHPAMEAALAEAEHREWPPALVRQLADNHQRQKTDDAGGVARWRTLESQLAAKNFVAAMATLKELESKGPLWFNGRTTSAMRPACERGLAFTRFREALARDPASARSAFLRVRAFVPDATLREALREAGWTITTPEDLASLERAFLAQPSAEERAAAPSLDWAALAAEVRLVRADARAAAGEAASARTELADTSSASPALRAEQTALAERLAREEPFDKWWAGQKRVAFLELPGSVGEWHTRIFFETEPTLAPEDLLPLLRTRVDAWGRAGAFADSYQGWEALFRVQREAEAVRAESERFEQWLAAFEEALPREDYAAHAALLLDVCPDYDMRDRLGRSLFRQFEADTPEATVAALRRWSEGRLTPGQQREFAYQVANYLYLRDRFPEAIAVLSAMETPTDRERLLRALCLLKREENDLAVAELKALVERHPKSPLADRAWFTLGWTYMVQADRPSAKAAFQRVTVDHPDSDYARQARNFLAQLP